MAYSTVVVTVKGPSTTLPPRAINTADVVFSILVLRLRSQGTIMYNSHLRRHQLLHGVTLITDNLLEVVFDRVKLIDA